MSTGEDQRLKAGELDDTLSYKLRLAQIAAYRNFEEKHPEYGSAPRYLGLLMVVLANPGQPQGVLAHSIAIRRSSIVPMLDKLEGEGLLERRPSEKDRRTKAVWLTAKGERIVHELRAIARRGEDALREGIDPREVEIAISVLDRIVAKLNAA